MGHRIESSSQVSTARGGTRSVLLCLSSLLILFWGPVNADVIHLTISKSEQRLMVKQGDDVIKSYPIALGKGGKGNKRRRGDDKTPVGHYRIAGFKEDSKFHYFMQISYPNLVDAWHGYNSRLISGEEFRQIATAYSEEVLPPQDTSLGGYIGLHGIGDVTEEKLEIHSMHNWTEGCIALRNSEINELRQYVSVGTAITITD